MTTNSEVTLQLSKTFGDIPGVPVGKTFDTRKEVKEAGLHKSGEAGISDTPNGATCIVINGEYPDEDHGYDVVYIGSGSGEEDQQWATGPNRSLVVSLENGNPVRVIRGSKGNPKWSPYSGYRYDGLYRVIDSRMVTASGGSGHRQCQFLLRRLPDQPPLTESKGREELEKIIKSINGRKTTSRKKRAA